MLIQLISSLILGILSGTLTGLIPGIHINLISNLLISLTLFSINPIYLITFITSMSITHTFLDFIPSIILGCPDTDTELSILPSQKLLKKGFGFQAITLTAYGGIIAMFILLIICIPSVFLLPKIFEKIKSLIPYILILASLFLILKEKRKQNAIVVFAVCGLLGLIVLNLENIKEPLLPLLTGLFGASQIFLSLKNKSTIPEQKIFFPKVDSIKPIFASIISAPICSFFPGLGNGQAIVLANSIIKQGTKNFLILTGITNTLVMGFSFISLYTIQKTRTGSSLAIKEIVGTISKEQLILIIVTIIFSSILAFILTIYLSKKLLRKIHKINYSKISFTTLFVLFILTLIISGFLGIIILIISTLTGIYCIKQKVRRTQMMGCLLLPTILFYL